ncbi:hypothetical protein DFP72DRAFT_53997 [Ephemerocybe angulata]|uniref:BTB domain-containing protein n=1 Tax=Ephemerocybe angulata TaxID=980116 RepID=A0A8H6HEY0_9AGAR|nr:hypothetical protein DFP72DRAFT_53997 [Tulosesus angulatus]
MWVLLSPHADASTSSSLPSRIYRIPKSVLEEWSQTFKDMFGIPQGESVEGSSDGNPIILPGCTIAEFEDLMKVLLTPTYVSSIKPFTLSEDQWIGVLKLSTMWDMSVVRKHVIATLSPMIQKHTAIEQVVLGKQFKVAAWFTQGCASLASEYKTIDLTSVADTLGWEFVARILRVGASAEKDFELTATSEFKCKNCKLRITAQSTPKCNETSGFGLYHGKWETNIRFTCASRSCSGISNISSIVVEKASVRVQTPDLKASISVVFKEELQEMYL